MSAVCVACGRVRTTEQDYHPIQVFTCESEFGLFSKDSGEMCLGCFTKLMRKLNRWARGDFSTDGVSDD